MDKIILDRQNVKVFVDDNKFMAYNIINKYRESTLLYREDALALADAIYKAEGRGWLPYPDITPEEDGDYDVLVLDAENNLLTTRDYWTDVAGWYHYDDDDVLSFLQHTRLRDTK